MRKFLILLVLILSLPAQAEQYKEFNGIVINKQQVTYIYMSKMGIYIHYPGSSSNWCLLPITNKDERIKQFKSLQKWLNERN